MKNKRDLSNCTDKEISIINCLKTGVKSIYELIEVLNLETSELLSSLTILEMKDLIKQLPGKKYILT